jgi:hypothetical protein
MGVNPKGTRAMARARSELRGGLHATLSI